MNSATIWGQREVCNCIFVSYETKQPILHMDWANTTSTEMSSDTVYARGGWGAPRRVGFAGEKIGTLSVETQMHSFQLYSLMTGAALENSAEFIQREKVVASEDGTLQLVGTPVGDVNVFAAEDDCGTMLTGATAEGSVISCDAVIAGSAYVVYYMKSFTENVQKISLTNTTLPKAVTIYAETYGKTENEEIVGMKMTVYKAQPSTEINWSFANQGDPTSLTINFEILADSDGRMLDFAMINE